MKWIYTLFGYEVNVNPISDDVSNRLDFKLNLNSINEEIIASVIQIIIIKIMIHIGRSANQDWIGTTFSPNIKKQIT